MIGSAAPRNRELRAPKRLLVTHFFKYQSHHSGEAHAPC